jgi:deazaflavin-dependent oxidoreductase (nitroreductase family)
MTTFRQEDHGFMTYPTSDWHRWAFRAPITLWRMGLGPIIGHIFMLITTTGRKSGLPRRTMVEYHALNGKKYAPCAFGARSDWYKNIAADPRVAIQTAQGAEAAIAVRVTGDQELIDVYELFKRRDPVVLNWYMQSLGIEDDPDDIVAKKDSIYWIRFDSTDEATPPPLEADLWWVLPVALVGLVGLWLLGRKRERCTPN